MSEPDKPIYRPHSPIQLKVKYLTLTQEARIIKRLENSLKRKPLVACKQNTHITKDGTVYGSFSGTYGPSPLNKPKRAEQFWSLRNHRKDVVRLEARATHLARGFLRGMDYANMEQKTHTIADNIAFTLWSKVEEMVRKYGEGDLRLRMQAFEEWMQRGAAYREAYKEAA